MIPMILLAFGLQVAAATPRAAQPPKPAGTTVVTPTPPRIEPPALMDDERRPVGPNVRVELTLSDLGGNGTAATTKTVTITSATDREWRAHFEGEATDFGASHGVDGLRVRWMLPTGCYG